jgi:hypothetical protein
MLRIKDRHAAMMNIQFIQNKGKYYVEFDIKKILEILL